MTRRTGRPMPAADLTADLLADMTRGHPAPPAAAAPAPPAAAAPAPAVAAAEARAREHGGHERVMLEARLALVPGAWRRPSLTLLGSGAMMAAVGPLRCALLLRPATHLTA